MSSDRRRLRAAITVLALGGVLVSACATGTPIASTSDHHMHMAPPHADVEFAQAMIAHHNQAVVMSGLALRRADPRVRQFAQLIRTNQLLEIGQMEGMLQLWGEPYAGSTGMHMGMAPSASGMATAPQLNRLRRSRGRAFDALFLRLMIRHHLGGIAMIDGAHFAVNAVADLSERMEVEQGIEVLRMSSMLPRCDWPGCPPRVGIHEYPARAGGASTFESG